MARFTQPITGDGSGTPGPQGDPGPAGADGTNGADGLDSLFLGTWNSVTEFLAIYQGGPIGLADGDWWAFVKDNTDQNKVYVVREDPNSATGWVIDDNESFVLPQGEAGADGADGENGTNGVTPFTYQGAFDYGVTYGPGDAVTFQGGLWKLNNFIGAAGYTPVEGQWTLIIPAGTPGADGADGSDGNDGAQGPQGDPGSPGLVYLGNYVSGNGYIANIAVVKGSDNNLYIATSSGGLGDPVGNSAEWNIFLPKGADGSDAPTNRIYDGEFQAIIDETGTTTFDGNLVPSANTYSLGTETFPWKDIYVSAGSIKIADNDMEEDAVSIKNTDGYLALSRGGLKVTDNTNEFQVFQLNPDGTLVLKSNVTETTTGAALEIIGSLNGTSIDPSNTGVLLHLTGLRDNPSRIYNDSYGTGVYSAYIGRHARGTSEDPEGLLAGDIISRIGGNAFLSSGVFAPISNVRMDFVTKENQTNTARGNEIQFWTTENGSTTPTRSFTLENTGITFPDSTKQTTAAVAQVNSDWNATTGKAEILNKPDLSLITPTLTSYNSTLSSPNLAYSGTPTTAVYIATGKMVHVQIDVNLATVTNFGTNGQQYLLTLPFTAAHDSLLIGQCKIGAIVYEIAGKVTAGSNSIGMQYCLSNGNNTPNTFEIFTKQHPANMTTATTFQISGMFISQ